MHWKVQSPSSPTESLTPASGTEKLFNPAPWAASAALATSLQGLGVPMLADEADGAAEEDSAEADEDAAEDEAALEAAELEAAELPEAGELLVEEHAHPTMPTAITAAKAMANSFLTMVITFPSLVAPVGSTPPGALTLLVDSPAMPISHLVSRVAFSLKTTGCN